MGALPGKPASLWLETSAGRGFPQPRHDLTVDVAVLGAGIVGITTALLLKQAGMTVAVLEARHVGAGVTGYTTAKVTSLHGLIYSRLASGFGDDAARVYGEANQEGLDRIARFVDQLGIECDFRRKPNYTYTESPSERAKIEDEVAAATRAGLPASLAERTDLPFDVAAAVRFEDQAEFHPLKYLHALSERVPGDGSQVFERVRALGVEDGGPCRVDTDLGVVVSAEHVVVATHMPMLDRGLFFARLHPERSYVLAVRLRGAAPQGMYLSTEQPAHSLRAHPVDGGELLLVGGESHKTGQSDAVERYRALEAYARARFDVEAVEYRWATQDNMPLDGLPYVGRLWPLSSRITTATGFQKWGLANGTAAAMMLADAILGRENPWAATFDTTRLNARRSLPSFVKENANVALHFFADRVTKRGAPGLAPGEGRVARSGTGQVAVSRDDDGIVQAVSARCTHLGCIVSWNDAERTWDCPCHGSRFASDGRVVQGPAVHPLRPVPAPEDA